MPSGLDEQRIGTLETLVIGPKAMMAVEAYVMGLFHLYPTLYLHKATRGAEKLFTELLARIITFIRNKAHAPTHPLPAQAGSHYESPRLPRRRRMREFVATWLEQHSTSPHTRRAYERTGRRFIAALGVPLRKARLEDVRRGFEAIALRDDGAPASRATLMAQTAIVKSLLSFGARVRYLEANLGELFKLKAVPADRARRILSEPDTFVLLRSAESDRDALLLEVGYYGGLRVSELVSLTWGQLLDREDGKMQIAGLVGKGGKEREVLLPADLAAIGCARTDRAPSTMSRCSRAAPQRCARPRIGRQRHLDARGRQDHQAHGRARGAAVQGVQGEVSPHWLRHAHASHALDNGAPISLVQQTLGHGIAQDDVDLCPRQAGRFLGALPEEGAVRNVRLHAMVAVVRVWP